MNIKSKIIKLLGGFTPKEQQYYISRIKYLISEKSILKTENDILKNETISLQDKIDHFVSEKENMVTLSIGNKNVDDKIIVNGQELISDSIELLKGSPVEIVIYDKKTINFNYGR